MLKSEGDGIYCDYCGAVVDGDFTYYSFDFTEIKVNNKVKSETAGVYSADICTSCMDLYKKRIKEAYTPPVPNQFSCDISGEKICLPSFIYYRCGVSQAIVTISGVQYSCTTCQEIRDPNAGPCDKCTPETKLSRTADVKVDDKYLDINCTQSVFDKFKAHCEFTKETGVDEWAK